MMPNLNLANQVLRAARPAATPRLALLPGGKFAAPIVKATTVPNAGMYGAGADLPGEPGGEIEPGILPGADGPTPGTFDPGTGDGRIDIDPSDPGGAGQWGDPSSRLGVGFNPISPTETWLGGRFLGFDPNTGKPVYDPLGSGSMGDLGAAGGPGGSGGGHGPTAANGGNPNYPGKWGFRTKYWVF